MDSLSIGEYEAAGGGTDGSQQPEQEQSAFLSRVVLQFTATGNFEQTANVLEQLYELPYMVVTEFYIDMENPQLPVGNFYPGGALRGGTAGRRGA